VEGNPSEWHGYGGYSVGRGATGVKSLNEAAMAASDEEGGARGGRLISPLLMSGGKSLSHSF
jgi:hypothetical protein